MEHAVEAFFEPADNSIQDEEVTGHLELQFDCRGATSRQRHSLDICQGRQGRQIEVTGRLIGNCALVAGHQEINMPQNVVCRRYRVMFIAPAGTGTFASHQVPITVDRQATDADRMT